MRFVCVLVLAAALFGAVALASVDHAPYKYTIDLDEEDDHMFDHVVHDMCGDAKHMTAFVTLLQQLSGKINVIDAATKKQIADAFALKSQSLYDQVDGMRKAFQNDEACQPYKAVMDTLTTADFLLLQIVYQISMSNLDNFMACTSVVAADEEGHVFHGRNLDWLNPEMYAPLASELTYVRRNEGKLEKVLVTMSFFPELTPTTAISKNLAFSFNAKVIEDENYNTQSMMACMLTPVQDKINVEPFSLSLRDLMIKGQDSFPFVYGLLRQQAKFCSAVYLAISGPGEGQGAIFTYSPSGLQSVIDLGYQYDTAEGDPRKPWYVVVSNKDIELENSKDWDTRYNKTIAVLNGLSNKMDAKDNEKACSIKGLEQNLLAVDGVRTERTCYVGTMDVRNFKYSFTVRGQKPKEEPNNNPPAEPEAAASLKPWAYAFILLGCIAAALF